ncbi:MAG: hypothetical protein EBR82_11235 [Caulobacteraceae bacterium]|nr:hypothetical protein [Caulobacteraceae bacterium]
MTTSVPSPTFGPRGFVAPSEPDILAGVQADLNAAFGGNLNPGLSTPQGQLATGFTTAIGEKNALLLQVLNGVDPALATGRLQDAIGRIYFLERIPAVATSVIATCSGSQGTIIPVGSLAISTAGDLYASTARAKIGAGGTVSVVFQCQTTGPVACPAGTLTSIYRAVPGWDSVTNPSDGTLGRDVETATEFEARRRASVALNAVGSLPSIRAAVLSVPGVLDAYVTDNSTASPVTTGGVTIPAYALYVAAAGGSGQAIAEAVWRKKWPGQPMQVTGATAYTVEDQDPAYAPPYPSYTVRIVTPSNLPIFIAVSITDSPAVPSDAQAQVRAAIANAFAGGDGGSRAGIGRTLYASRFLASVVALGAWASNVISISIGTSASPTGDTVAVNINALPTLSTANVTLTLV